MGEKFDGDVDIVVLPALAVDENGNRLGYGKGYYDRYLQRHPRSKTVAFCYDFQIVQKVPCEAWDKRVDAIVTDKRVLKIAKE